MPPQAAQKRKGKRAVSGSPERSGTSSKRKIHSQSGATSERTGKLPFPTVSEIEKQIKAAYKGKPRSEYFSALLAALWFNLTRQVFNPEAEFWKSQPGLYISSKSAKERDRWRTAIVRKTVSAQDEIGGLSDRIMHKESRDLLIKELQYLLEYRMVTTSIKGVRLPPAVVINNRIAQFESSLDLLEAKEQKRDMVKNDSDPQLASDEEDTSKNTSKDKKGQITELARYKHKVKLDFRRQETWLINTKNDEEMDRDAVKRIENIFKRGEKLGLLTRTCFMQDVINVLEKHIEQLAVAKAEKESRKLSSKEAQVTLCMERVRIDTNRHRAELTSLLNYLQSNAQINQEMRGRIEALDIRFKEFGYELLADNQPSSSELSIEKPMISERDFASKFWELLDENEKKDLKDMKGTYIKRNERLKKAQVELAAKYPGGPSDMSTVEQHLKELTSSEMKGLVSRLEEVENTVDGKFGRLGIEFLRLDGFP